MQQAIVGFHRDEVGDWVAELACGHGQHVRHEPPFQMRPWVVTPEGRAGRLGSVLECKVCDEDTAAAPKGPDEGGEAACWAAMVCDRCGSLIGTGGHACDESP